MRQQRVQLSNDLSRLTNVLLSGKEAVESSDGKPHNEQTILAAAGPAGSAARQVYSRRISEIGLDLTTPRKQGLPAATSSRSISSKLDSLATPRVGSIEKEAELEANIERLQVSIRQKDDSLFRLQAEHKELHSRFDFLEQESSEQSGLVAELRTQAEAADATRRELEVAAQEKVSLLEALKEAQSLQDQLRTELAAAQVNLQSTTDEGAKVSEVLQERDDTIQSLREEISHLQTKLHEGKAELDKVNSKTAATARLLSSLSHSRDQAEARARESEEKAASTSERAECAEEALVLLQQSLIDSRLAWEKKEQQLLADLDESNSHTERLQESTDELRTEKTALEDKLDAMSTKLARCEQDLHMLREARKPALPTSRYGPSADDLSAKLDALTNSTSRSVSGTGSRLSAAHPSQESDKSAMMQLTISEQRSKIQELERALRDSQEGGVLSRPRPSTSLGHASTILQDEGITIDGKVRSEETSRLNQVIESQKVTISDLQEDLFQWRTVSH